MKIDEIVKKQLLIIVLTALVSYAQDPGSPPPDGGGEGRGGPRHGGFHILPPHAEMQLNLTADQRKQLDALEAEVKSKIESILTHEQLEKLKQMRPPKRKDGPGEGKPESDQGGKASCPPTTSGTSH